MARKGYTDADREGARRLGMTLAAARAARALSRNDVARVAGVSPEHLRLIEIGDKPGVGFLLMARIAGAVGVELAVLARVGTNNERAKA